MAARIAGRPHAGEEASDTRSRYEVEVLAPSSPPVDEVAYQEFGDGLQPEEQVFIGLVGTDGSMINPRSVCARRTGWSAAKCAMRGKLPYAVNGTRPDH